MALQYPTDEVPNPNTPLAFLQPTLADQFEVSRYLYAVTFGAYLWDLAINLDSDYKLLFCRKVRYATIAYWLSRIFTFAYVITNLVFQIGHVPNCQALLYGVGACAVLSQSFTALLFFLRVVAIWRGNKRIFALFAFLWMCVTGAMTTIPAGIGGGHIGPTQQCIDTYVAPCAKVAAIAGFIYDSAIFVAISYRILTRCIVEDTFKGRVRAFFGGASIPQFSRALLQGGVHYYLVALFGHILLIVLGSAPGLPPTYRGVFSIPVWAMINAMACIVFRKIAFGRISADGVTVFTLSDTSRTLTAQEPVSDSALPLHIRCAPGTSADFTPSSADIARIMIAKTVKVEVVGDNSEDDSYTIARRACEA
ncbi:hypothetical protein BV22DRAFT_1125960 [Leucogyrophana mollusca]|uniref:Uncharacterized protein n=1 Tax=Leucogyrophana mollusca TaxID=85980 RepID=A0ACB8BVN3_9AGAM|nr:hypothetical protein BV22DRAFT_1125960 [Leucogyrophana mollusca]